MTPPVTAAIDAVWRIEGARVIASVAWPPAPDQVSFWSTVPALPSLCSRVFGPSSARNVDHCGHDAMSCNLASTLAGGAAITWVVVTCHRVGSSIPTPSITSAMPAATSTMTLRAKFIAAER